jgi:hypothetical protein
MMRVNYVVECLRNDEQRVVPDQRRPRNVPVRAVHGFAQCTRNTVFAISKMRLYNTT